MINFENLKKLSRGYTLSMSITPFFVAFVCALQYVILKNEIDFWFFVNSIFAFIGVIAAHAFTNIFDDYIDVKNELKKGLSLNQINFRSKRKARAILDGLFSMEKVEGVLEILAIITFFTALYFICLRGSVLLGIILPAALLTLLYPSLSKYCLSEAAIALIFGPLLINGSFYAMTGTFNSMVFEISIAIGLITSVLVIAHSLMDYEHDILEGKKTLPIVLKNKKYTIMLVAGLILISYGLLINVFTSYKINIFIVLPVIATVLIGIELVKSLFDYINIKDVQFIPKKYYGKMENWNEIINNNYAYYMYRFYLARNIAVIFNITLAFSILLNINVFLALIVGAGLYVLFI